MISVTRRALLAAGAAFVATVAVHQPATADDTYPDRTITLVVPFAAGGSSDAIARIVTQKMSDVLGQQIIVENVGGGGGTIGTGRVARADPDGYTLVYGTPSLVVSPLIMPKVSYDWAKDFTGISLLLTVPNVILVNPSFPAKDYKEFLAVLKANPDTYSYASAGNGTAVHLTGELFKLETGVSMQHIPYKGSGPALNDVIGNQVPIIFDNMPSASSHIKAGTLRALAVTSIKRAEAFPDIPTLDESGLKGFDTYTWNALLVPKATPPEIIAKLNDAALKALADPGVIEHLKAFSVNIVGSAPEAVEAHLVAQTAKWAPVVEKAHVRAD